MNVDQALDVVHQARKRWTVTAPEPTALTVPRSRWRQRFAGSKQKYASWDD